MLRELKRDSVRYADLGGWYSHPGFWIGAIYRFGVWAHSRPSALLRLPVWVLYRVARAAVRVLFNVDFWAGRSGVRIGAGLCLIHPSDIMIGQGVEIGEDCLIFHQVTIGTGPTPGVPKIGNGVDVYVGARVLGGITIGDLSMIGANCVVMRDVPPHTVVLPAANLSIPRSLSPVAGSANQGNRANATAKQDGPPR